MKENPVAHHYSCNHLFESILLQLEEKVHEVTRNDISGVDEFHVRGADVSLELAKEAGFKKGSRVLDIGCGIGGPARMLADVFDCHVTGIDITQEYVRTAKLLSGLVGLDDHTTFIQADAQQLPFENGSFNYVWTQHAQMNIQDKNKFYSEIKRVLTSKGQFIYYDIFTLNNGPIHYPVPWADDSSISYLVTAVDVKAILLHLGFTQLTIKDQTEEGRLFLRNLLNRITTQEFPKITTLMLMGDRAAEKLNNLLTNLTENKIELQSGIYQLG